MSIQIRDPKITDPIFSEVRLQAFGRAAEFTGLAKSLASLDGDIDGVVDTASDNMEAGEQLKKAALFAGIVMAFANGLLKDRAVPDIAGDFVDVNKVDPHALGLSQYDGATLKRADALSERATANAKYHAVNDIGVLINIAHYAINHGVLRTQSDVQQALSDAYGDAYKDPMIQLDEAFHGGPVTMMPAETLSRIMLLDMDRIDGAPLEEAKERLFEEPFAIRFGKPEDIAAETPDLQDIEDRDYSPV